MGRKKETSQIYASAIPYSKPEGLERAQVTDSQARWDEQTIRWGDDDDSLPIRILQAINQSPTTTSCLGKVADYMQGSGFTDKGLENMVIDIDGTTLKQLHNTLCDYMAKLEGFATRFTLDREGRIVSCFAMPVESCRFVRPDHSQSRKITKIKYNPYWGTSEFDQKFTTTYNIWEADKVKRYQEIKQADKDKYNGQIYFEGTPRAPYKFYPVPKFWSGSQWIYVDLQTQSFVKKLLDNGFFQSVLINMIGDPNQKSKNPKYIKKTTGTDGSIREEFTKTIGEEFSEMMQGAFSGHDKSGTAMVFWAQNQNDVAKIQPFPVNANFDNISGTITNAIRGITIATEVPAILANLPQQVSSLGSDGDAMRVAVELMQARVKEPQQILENFYNNVLLPNMQNKTTSRVKIINHTPLSNQVQVPDKVWEWMNDDEKAEFVRMNIPSVTVKRLPTVAPAAAIEAPQDPNAPQPTQEAAPAAVTPNSALANLNLAQLNKVQKLVARYNLSLTDPANTKALTYEQAVQLIKALGFTDDEVGAWLVKPEEI